MDGQKYFTPRRKAAKKTRQSLFAILCAVATLREVVYFLRASVEAGRYFTDSNASAAGCCKPLICTRRAPPEELWAEAAWASMLAEGMPVRAYDFSQSCVEGPRILPSM
jgi:hypothetical protein